MNGHASKTRQISAPPEEPLEPLPILVVDDDDVILRAISRLLRQVGAKILTAESGEDAAEIIDDRHIGVVISDQRMPGMSGAELLEYVSDKQPQAVRIMITGNNEVDTVTAAINRGEVFRFISKPWDNHALLKTAQDAIDLNRLRRSKSIYEERIRAQNNELKSLNEDLEARVEERTREVVEKAEEIEKLYEKLEDSFDATMRALLSTMELGHSAIVRHCQRTLQRVEDFGPEAGVDKSDMKHLRRAAILHWIGLINAPEDVFRKPVSEYGHDEQAFWEFHPLLGQQAICHVPVLEMPGRIILLYLKDWTDGQLRADVPSDEITFEVTDQLARCCQVLRICSEFEHARTIRGQSDDDWHASEEGLAEIQSKRGQAFSPGLVDKFVQSVSQKAFGIDRHEVEIALTDLEPGMVLARPVETVKGIPVAARGMVITEELIDRFQNFHTTTGLDTIFVWDA